MIRAAIFIFICFLSYYGKAQQPRLILPIGHTTRVHSIAFSPDGKKVVTASRDNSVKIWDAHNGLLLADLKGHNTVVNSAVFSKDSKMILSISSLLANVWDAQTGNLMSSFKVDAGINSAAFSPDGKKIIIASHDSTVNIWNIDWGNHALSLVGHRGPVNTALFSNDGKKILTASDDGMAKIWDALTGKLLYTLKGHRQSIRSANFNPDGKKLVTTSSDSTAKVWDAVTGKLLFTLKGHGSDVISASYSPDGNRIVTSSYDSTSRLWNAMNGKLLVTIKGEDVWVSSPVFSPDGKKILTASFYDRVGRATKEGVEAGTNMAKIWDANSGKLLANLKGHVWNVVSAVFSPDGKKIATASWDGTAKIWNAETNALSADLNGHSYLFSRAFFSPDGKKIVTSAFNESAFRLWDAWTGNLLAVMRGHTQQIYSVIFSPDSKKIISCSADSTAKIWDVRTGQLLNDLKGHKNYVFTAAFNPACTEVITASGDNTAKVWDLESGKLLKSLEKNRAAISAVMFSPDGKKILTSSFDKTANVWDAQSGNLLADLRGHTALILSAEFNRDGTKVVTVAIDSSARVWDSQTGALLNTLDSATYKVKDVQFNPAKNNSLVVCSRTQVRLIDVSTTGTLKEIKEFSQNGYKAAFSPDGKKVFIAALDSSSRIVDAENGKLLADLNARFWSVFTADFSPDNKKVLTISFDGMGKIWNVETGELLYSFVAVDSTDYLVMGKYNHYDGSPGARKLLYFVCNDEVIGLEQVKDQLWVPNLAERINNGETINAKRIQELNLCGLTPLTEEGDSKPGEYCFRITPRRGGLGETVLYINGIEAKRYQPQQLVKIGGTYELRIKKGELIEYFIAGSENPVTVKAYTADNAISSRVIRIIEKNEKTVNPTNLYAIMIGISDYKGDDLDLQFAAKDATDISSAIAVAARKLLNTDNREHVFMYNMTTNKDRYQLPEKNSIKKLLEEIGKKAVSNDLLLVFFAGHGVMEGDKKQFYFLTSDASLASAMNTVADVGISTAELTEWMKPNNIKAQKRILIFDACKSGQAIKDFIKIGTDNQNYMSARSDEKGMEIKAIEKLNEKSGLFILSASASDQKAYETGRYSQGLLTYSLLKVIKEQADILEDGKYLNVSRWFNAAEKTVSELSKENGARQEPQIVTNTNFNIGVVDEEVIATIVLPAEKPLFAAANLQNADENIADDNLEISKVINRKLIELASFETNSKISFVAITNSPDAWSLSGRYEVKGDEITARVNLKHNKEIRYRFEVKGVSNNFNELGNSIMKQAMDWIEKNK